MKSAIRIIVAVALPLLVAPPVAAQEEEDSDTSQEEEEGDDEAPVPAPPPPAAPVPAPAEPVEAAAPVTAETPVQNAVAAARVDEANAEAKFPRIDFSGYVRGGFAFRVRPDALPKDEYDYGFDGLGGLDVIGWAHRMWKGALSIEIETGLRTVRDVTLQPDGLLLEFSRTGLSIQEATAQFLPHETVTLKAGVTRIPFTLQQQSDNSALMFPNRSSANRLFFTGADVGGVVEGDFFDGILISSAGVFNGDSITNNFPRDESRGVAMAARVDVQPFGAYPFSEGDLLRGDYRLGLGFGIMFQPATLYDRATGTEPRKVVDLRLAASLRMSVKGVYVAAEYFRRQQEDDFSFRPEVADGAYGQVGVLIPFSDDIGIEPIVRVGFVAADQTFDPRLTGNIDAGLNFYPLLSAWAPDAVKVTLFYLGERRFSENEEAHGGAANLQIRF